jgi:hypothetical protein
MESTSLPTATLNVGTTLGVANTALIVGGAVYFHKKTQALQIEHTKVQQTLNEMALNLKGTIPHIRGTMNNMIQNSDKTNKGLRTTMKSLESQIIRIDRLEEKIDHLIEAITRKGLGSLPRDPNLRDAKMGLMSRHEAPVPFQRRSRRSDVSRKSRHSRSYKNSSESNSASQSSTDPASPIPTRRPRSNKNPHRRSSQSSSDSDSSSESSSDSASPIRNRRPRPGAKVPTSNTEKGSSDSRHRKNCSNSKSLTPAVQPSLRSTKLPRSGSGRVSDDCSRSDDPNVDDDDVDIVAAIAAASGSLKTSNDPGSD